MWSHLLKAAEARGPRHLETIIPATSERGPIHEMEERQDQTLCNFPNAEKDSDSPRVEKMEMKVMRVPQMLLPITRAFV